MSQFESGNTKIGFKHKNWIMTLNEKTLKHYDDILNYLTGRQSLNYLLVVEHLNSENKHYHVLAQFKNTTSLSLKKLHGAHVEPVKGTIKQAYEYLMCHDDKHIKQGIKAEIINEFGEMSLVGGSKIKDCLMMTDEELNDLPLHMYNIVKQIKIDKENELDIDEIYKVNLEVVYICGPSGIGKSKSAFEIIKQKGYRKFNMVKYENGFWNGVSKNAIVAVYDDFRDSHMKASEFINFIDYNKHILNIKGGQVLNNYKLIIITSIQTPDEIYKKMDDEPRNQWLRRMKIINLYEGNDVID